MSLFPIQATVAAVTYRNRSALFAFTHARTTWYALARRVIEDPTCEIETYTWFGHFDRPGSMLATNGNRPARHRNADVLALDIIAVLQNRDFAYWIEKQSATWQEFFPY